jgi:hypothetical protein
MEAFNKDTYEAIWNLIQASPHLVGLYVARRAWVWGSNSLSWKFFKRFYKSYIDFRLFVRRQRKRLETRK